MNSFRNSASHNYDTNRKLLLVRTGSNRLYGNMPVFLYDTMVSYLSHAEGETGIYMARPQATVRYIYTCHPPAAIHPQPEQRSSMDSRENIFPCHILHLLRHIVAMFLRNGETI
jgi:hypothetical protein